MPYRHSLLILIVLVASIWRPVSALEVAFIGDKSKRAALQQVAQEMKAPVLQSGGVLRVTSPNRTTTYSVTESNDNPFLIANQLLTADLALLVVDSTQGPLPSVREQLIIARQTRIPRIAIYFSNTRTLLKAAPKDAPELLELEEMEMRELMNKYEMGGERAVVLFDGDVSKLSKLSYTKGTTDLQRYLGSISIKRPAQPSLRPVSEFNCYYYLLSNPEANGRGVTLTDRTHIDVWIEGNSSGGTVRTSSSHRPGDNGEVVLQLSSPLRAIEGARVLLVNNGVTVGVGVVKNVLR